MEWEYKKGNKKEKTKMQMGKINAKTLKVVSS
jgi:hypothetical protein